jgi:hypothetical protein
LADARCHASIKAIAINAFTSVLDIVIKNLTTGMQHRVYENWLIAAVAAVGVFLLGFEKLRAWGAVLVGERKEQLAALTKQ